MASSIIGASARAHAPTAGNSTAGTPAGDQQPVERELRITIYPRGFDLWQGTSAQLRAEGVIPDGFDDWPIGRAHRWWESGQFKYWLFRERPEGHKGPPSSWAEVDNWVCRRILKSHASDGFRAADIYAARQALAKELWTDTPEARVQNRRHWEAYWDSAFQAFKALVPGLVPPKRGRKASKAQASQGAQP